MWNNQSVMRSQVFFWSVCIILATSNASADDSGYAFLSEREVHLEAFTVINKGWLWDRQASNVEIKISHSRGEVPYVWVLDLAEGRKFLDDLISGESWRDKYTFLSEGWVPFNQTFESLPAGKYCIVFLAPEKGIIRSVASWIYNGVKDLVRSESMLDRIAKKLTFYSESSWEVKLS